MDTRNMETMGQHMLLHFRQEYSHAAREQHCCQKQRQATHRVPSGLRASRVSGLALNLVIHNQEIQHFDDV